MSNARVLLISLIVSLVAVFMIYGYLSKKEKSILELATSVPVIVAVRDIPAGQRVDSAMLERTEVPQKYIQPGTFNDTARIINRVIDVPVLKGTQILESMFSIVQSEGIGAKIPAEKRAFSIFVTDVTAVGELIQPGDMVDLMVTVEVGSHEGGRSVSEEIITKTALENVLVLAVNKTSSVRRLGSADDLTQEAAGSLFRAGSTGGGQQSSSLKTLTLALNPREVQIMNLSQEIGTISVALRSSFDSGKIENLPPLSAQDFLGIKKIIVPRNNPSWVEIKGAEAFSRY